MNSPECYKCGSAENLSHKNKRLMICRSCRNKQYEANKDQQKYLRFLNQSGINPQKALEWRMYAREVNTRIMLKYK